MRDALLGAIQFQVRPLEASGVASSEDPTARLIDRRFRMHERGLISDEELGRSVVDDLAFYRGFGLVEPFVRQLPSRAAAAAEQYSREVSAPEWTTIVWGLGSAPTATDLERGLAALKQVAGQVLEALSGNAPDAEHGAAPDPSA